MGTTFTVDASTTNTLVTHAYNAPGTFRVGVKYMDNDGQWSQPYPFTITIREVRRVFYVKDHLGNIRQSINESGTVVSAQDYYPYGETHRGYISVHPYEKYRFTEKERDIETGYDYFGGRLYDPALPMWLQVDPLSDKYPGVSPYNYCLNDPLNNFDPDGLTVWSMGISKGIGNWNFVGFMGSVSVVLDDKGNAGILATGGVGPTIGTAWMGTSISFMPNFDKDNIFELEGPGYAFGGVVGMGATMTGEWSGGSSISGSVGKGEGLAAYGMVTYSHLFASCKVDNMQDVINNFSNGGYALFNAISLSLMVYDRAGKLIKEITFDDGEESSKIPELKMQDTWKQDTEKVNRWINTGRDPGKSYNIFTGEKYY